MTKRSNYRKKRKYRKKRNNTNAVVSGNYSNLYSPSPMPNTYKARLRYATVQDNQLNPGAGGSVATHVFSANGIYDVDITGVGHQPTGFDELMAMYDHATVISSKITVTFSSGQTKTMLCGVTLSDVATVSSDPRVLVENGRTQLVQVPGYSAGAQQALRTITSKCNPNKFLGRPDPMSEDDLRNSASSNPAEQAYWHVWAAPNDTTDASAIDFQAILEYIVIFTEPNKLALS